MATASAIEIRRAEAQEQAATELSEIKAALVRIEAALGTDSKAATSKTQKLDDADAAPKAKGTK